MNSLAGRIMLAIVAALGAFSLGYAIFLNAGGRSAPELSQSSREEQSLAGEKSADSSPEPESEPFDLLVCGVDNSKRLTDVIIVARVDMQNNRINMLQIPRDTYIGEGYATGKINAVYSADGIDGLRGMIAERFSVEAEHYVTVTLDAFRGIVDDLGGVELDVPQRIVFTKDKIIEKGRQTLDGERAEWFVRYRAGYALADIGRMGAQELFLRALATAASQKSGAELALIAGKRLSEIETDLTLAEILRLVSEFSGGGRGTPELTSHIVPGEGRMVGGYAVYMPYEEQTAELIAEIFGERPVYGAGEIDKKAKIG